MADDSPALEQHDCDAGANLVRIADLKKLDSKSLFLRRFLDHPEYKITR
jgi:hypothetical protein